MHKPEKLPVSKLIIFVIGQFGWSLASFGVVNLINYFYMPAEGAMESDFPIYIFQGSVLGLATVIGLLNAGARVFDGISDPLIAGWSDRSVSKFGRRRLFMAISVLPFALLSALVFFPPVVGDSGWNIAWVSVTIVLFYLFMTVYCVPYNALIAEFTHTPTERLNMSTAISLAWAIGFALGSQVYSFQDNLEKSGLSSTEAFQRVMMGFALISFIAMLLPIVFIDENRYSGQHVSEESPFEGVFSTFKNKNFRYFITGDLTYWLGLTFATSGMNYYVTLLLEQDASKSSFYSMIMFAISFLLYVPVNLASKRFGKKPVMVLGFVVYSLLFLMIFFMGENMGIPVTWQAGIMVVFLAIPVAIFGILTTAFIADEVEADGRETGNYKAGTYFAVRTFTMKLGVSLANLVFPSLLLFGKSTENPFGVRLTGLAAFVFCVLGMIAFLQYKEREFDGE